MKNLDVFRQIIERGFNQGDLSVADEICSPSLAEHQYQIPSDLRGPDILKFQITSARAEMRGLILTIEDHVDDGKQLWVRLRATGISPPLKPNDQLRRDRHLPFSTRKAD